MTDKKNEKLIYGYPESIHNLAETYIRRDIFKCDSNLVGDLLTFSYELGYGDISGEFCYDNIRNFYDDSIEAVEEYLVNSTENETWVDLPFDERENLAKDLGFEPEPKDVYEWWAISQWLAEQLIQMDEPVLVNSYGNWWGRTCTGQAIILDCIVQKIAEKYLR